MDDFIRSLPKAELHLHIEGTLEPELMFALARRNDVALPYPSVEAARRAYVFDDLHSFLDVYYEGARVLVDEQSFYDVTRSYLEKAKEQGVHRAEIFFDPQSHTQRGVAFEAVITGIHRALEDGRRELGVSSGLILCFLRHLDAASAMRTLDQAMPFRSWLLGVGLDSTEVGNPPERFAEVFAAARDEGLHVVAHAGEEGPPEYVWQALDVLGAERIDHGVRALEDPALVRRLAADRVPLTVCPLSNVCLGVFPSIAEHNLKRMLDAGLCVTINSDDPAYFGGYLVENYAVVARELGLTREELAAISANGFEAAFSD